MKVFAHLAQSSWIGNDEKPLKRAIQSQAIQVAGARGREAVLRLAVRVRVGRVTVMTQTRSGIAQIDRRMAEFSKIELRLGSSVPEEFERRAVCNDHHGAMRKDHQMVSQSF